MKILEKVALYLYSLIVLILSMIVCLLIFNWVNVEWIANILRNMVSGDVSSKVALVVSILFILLSIRCILFDEDYRAAKKLEKNIYLKNEHGKLLISMEAVQDIVYGVTEEFDGIESSDIDADWDKDEKLIINLDLSVTEDVVIKEFSTNLQNRIKEKFKQMTDLEIKEININVAEIVEKVNYDIEE